MLRSSVSRCALRRPFNLEVVYRVILAVRLPSFEDVIIQRRKKPESRGEVEDGATFG